MEFDLTKRLPAWPAITAEAVNNYFSLLALKGQPRYAAMMCGIEPCRINAMCKDDDEMAIRKMDALEEYKELIGMELHRRAVDGVVEDIYHNGRVVGQKVVASDRLLLALAKAHDPKFRDHLQVDATVKAGVLVVNAALDPDDWEKQYGDMRVDNSRLDSISAQQSQAGSKQTNPGG